MKKIEKVKRKSKIKIRRQWLINPRTRIHDNNEKIQIKKSRLQARKMIKEAMKDYKPSLFYSFRISIEQNF